jgi:aspartate kinase
MCILSLVGKLQNMVGIAGRMFTTLAQGDVNIDMISQGSSEINISCVIAGQDAVKALNLIHQNCLQIKPEGARGRGQSFAILSWKLFDAVVAFQWALGYSEIFLKY